jgi:trehalose 2-sulfotransferase
MSVEGDAPKRYDLTAAEHDYPVWDGPPRRTILICTHPRSGSTLLGEALYFTGGLGCPIEYFHRGFRPGLAERWDTTTFAEHVAAVRRLRTEPGGTLSVKLFWRDIEEMAAELAPERFAGLHEMPPDATSPDDYREIARLLAQAFPDAEFIHLWRSDRVRQAVSGLAALQTGIWRVIPETGEKAAIGPPEYDFDCLDGFVAYADFCNAHWRNFFDAIDAVPFTLTYERLAADYEGTVRAVLDHLGSDAPVPPVRMRRQSGAVNEAFVLRYLRDRQFRD